MSRNDTNTMPLTRGRCNSAVFAIAAVAFSPFLSFSLECHFQFVADDGAEEEEWVRVYRVSHIKKKKKSQVFYRRQSEAFTCMPVVNQMQFTKTKTKSE